MQYQSINHMKMNSTLQGLLIFQGIFKRCINSKTNIMLKFRFIEISENKVARAHIPKTKINGKTAINHVCENTFD